MTIFQVSKFGVLRITWTFDERVESYYIPAFLRANPYSFKRTQTSALLHHLSWSLLYFYPDPLPLYHPHRLHRQLGLTLEDFNTRKLLNHRCFVYFSEETRSHRAKSRGCKIQVNMGCGIGKNGSSSLSTQGKPNLVYLLKFRHGVLQQILNREAAITPAEWPRVLHKVEQA